MVDKRAGPLTFKVNRLWPLGAKGRVLLAKK
jgi:hypothetical protein